MFCPECNQNLASTTLITDTGRIELDYCSNCAGVWSDQGEINFLQEKDLRQLQKLLPDKPSHSSLQNFLCPRDRSTLEIYKGENVPVNINIFRCPKCSGIWFPDQMLPRFKNAQSAKLNYFKTWNIPLHSIYAILLPMLVISILGGGLIATLIGLNQNTDYRSRAKDAITEPLTISPSATQMLISFSTAKESTAKIRYWITTDEVTETWISTTPKLTHSILIGNLLENQTYSFQIFLVEPEAITSPVYTFTAHAP